MKKAFVLLAMCFVWGTLANAAEPNSVRMVKSEMTRNPEPRTIDFNVNCRWNYTHGLLLQSFMLAAEKHPSAFAGSYHSVHPSYLSHDVYHHAYRKFAHSCGGIT